MVTVTTCWKLPIKVYITCLAVSFNCGKALYKTLSFHHYGLSFANWRDLELNILAYILFLAQDVLNFGHFIIKFQTSPRGISHEKIMVIKSRTTIPLFNFKTHSFHLNKFESICFILELPSPPAPIPKIF